MKNRLLSLLFLSTSTYAADMLQSWFSDGNVNANLRYYYIETKKQEPSVNNSIHANAIGGKLHYETAQSHGLKSGVTFMTTNGFALPDNIDTSVLARDNGVRLGTGVSGEDARSSITVLGEAYLQYQQDDWELGYGRYVMRTPLIHEKDVRMIPSTVQGGYTSYQFPYGTTLGVSYLTHFKQRTSDRFINIVQHALGDNTEAITGSGKQDIAVLSVVHEKKPFKVSFYNYYASDFMNSLYFDMHFKGSYDKSVNYNTAMQLITQRSIGNANDNLALAGSLTNGKSIAADAIAIKGNVSFHESDFTVSGSKVFTDSEHHDSLVLPWDGTPLYTNMITSNNLFQSNYGKALTADSVYIGGSLGMKASYTQSYGFTGLQGIKTKLAYLCIDNNRFAKKQHDLNAVVSYKRDTFDIALKGIWVRNNSSADVLGNVSQVDHFTQYRIILNYAWD